MLGSVKSGLLVEVVRRGSAPAELAATVRAMVRLGIGLAVGRHGVRSAAIVTADCLSHYVSRSPLYTILKALNEKFTV